MAKKSVHQEFNPDAIEHFNINCDPYGVMVDNSGTIETVYLDESYLTSDRIKKILDRSDDGDHIQPDLTLYKKAFLIPNSPISQDRVKEALKEHKITLTNDYTQADLYLSHHDLQRETENGENINGRAILNKLWNFDAVESGCRKVAEYCADNSRDYELARVILDNKCRTFVDMYNNDSWSCPYDSWMLTGLAVNMAYNVEVNNVAIFDVEKVMHQSATKCELTIQLIEDILNQMDQGEEGHNMVGAILPTIDYNNNHHLLWRLAQEIGTKMYYFNRNKDVQYWKNASNIEDFYHMTALDMIKYLEKKEVLNKASFKYLEPIVRKEIKIENRDLYTFRVEVKPEYKKLMI